MKRPTTIRLSPELERASEAYVRANETNLAQITRLALRRFLEAEGYIDPPKKPVPVAGSERREGVRP